MNYKNYIVPKPWGYEYLIFENGNIGIWLLHIEYGQRTSLHCHPDKKTGLIILRGDATISFLTNDIPMPPFSKIVIREGVFHTTYAQSTGGIDVIEVETPKNKDNLVRMEDAYGRKGSNYESPEVWVKKTSSQLWIEDALDHSVLYLNCRFSIHLLTRSLINKLHEESIIIILSPLGIVTRDEKYGISKIGDTIKVKLIRRLLNDFVFHTEAKALIIEKL
jgi:hypothetical protein